MTLPFERSNAIKQTEKFLLELRDHSDQEVARRASMLLRHYPNDFDMEEAARTSPNVFGSMTPAKMMSVT